ncbi:MAG: MarR family transcriptional regulator [Bacteroidales bacterium]|jgi:DNA-binding MarR family transcriptional regulator|nr:MarR family transcriptional regulator [Bacteroidales bacterium]MBR6847580.1 MarR family transcriptional regulator [Bacteroidales bacterium]
MMLVKQVGVLVNILNCKLKKHIASVFKKEGINLTAEQFLVMDTLWNQGEMTQQNIAYIIQKDKNSVTQFIDNLEKKGLVQRVVDTADRRVNNIKLSKAGLAMKDNTKKVAIAAVNDILEGIPEEELKDFVKVLNKACENIEKLEP